MEAFTTVREYDTHTSTSVFVCDAKLNHVTAYVGTASVALTFTQPDGTSFDVSLNADDHAQLRTIVALMSEAVEQMQREDNLALVLA